MIGDFHFIRPWWLLALIPAAWLWWTLRRRTDAAQPWHGIIAPHLLTHLLSGVRDRPRAGPLNLIAVGWGIAVVSIASPSWRREPTPFADDTAALAIVLKVSPSMMTEDVQPSRLARATQKIHDLLAARGGAKNCLVAYAGTAHVVMPLTTDGGIIDTFAQALQPKIMPQEGDAAADALRLAERTLKDAGSGSILWITDSVAPEQLVSLKAWRAASKVPVRLLPPLLPGSELETLTETARSVSASVTSLTADESDVESLARLAKFTNVPVADAGSRWQEGGYWLTPALALLLIPFFRRGWMVSTAPR